MATAAWPHLPPSGTQVLHDRTLVERIAAGDATALSELQRRHWKRLYALSYGLLADPHAAEQVVARAFEQLWRGGGLDRSAGTTTVSASLSQLCRSLTVSHSAR
jgi:DNA-directed RNA polymerase specialized sigma24 family protein